MNHAITLLAAASEETANHGGPGPVLRTVVVVGVVGAALLAWFLLRGYRDGGNG